MADTSSIHPLAVIEPGAKIGQNVTIEPFAVIKSKVTLEDNVVVKSHAYIDGNTSIGEGSVIWPFASIGTKTQDLKFQGETTFVKIGKRCDIREGVTINSSSREGSMVVVGDHCLIMAYCHLAHHCELGNHVIMANSALLAGHVVVEDYAIIGGMTPVHQFCRIGRHAMVGGFSRISHDIPPYTIGGGFPYKFGGINLIGLKRRQFSLETRKVLTQAFRITYRMGLGMQAALDMIERDLPPIPEIVNWLSFCRSSKRGLLGLQGVTRSRKVDEYDEEFFQEQKIPAAVK